MIKPNHVHRSNKADVLMLNNDPQPFITVAPKTYQGITKKKSKDSNSWFRSRDLRVMSPARFRCAKLLLELLGFACSTQHYKDSRGAQTVFFFLRGNVLSFSPSRECESHVPLSGTHCGSLDSDSLVRELWIRPSFEALCPYLTTPSPCQKQHYPQTSLKKKETCQRSQQVLLCTDL